MIKFIIARHDDKVFNEYLKPSLDKIKTSHKEFGIYDDFSKSIFSKYNKGIDESQPEDDDILIFAHEDIKILDENLVPKLEMIFKKKPQVGIVGIVGTKELGDQGWWSNDYKHHVGHWHQEFENGDVKHLIRKIGFDDNMLVIDGCFFAVRGKVAKEVKFLEEVFSNYFHFYDYSYSISVLEKGWKVAVADIGILHKSEGNLPQNWHQAKKIFHDHYKSKGYQFPLTLEQIKINK